MDLKDFNDHYDYKKDPKSRDMWRVLKADDQGIYAGDCEDYALSVLYYVICKSSWLKFWWLIVTFQARLIGCYTKNREGHAVLRYQGQFIDNWSKKWVERAYMEGIGHKFWPWYRAIIPTTVAAKMMIAKLGE